MANLTTSSKYVIEYSLQVCVGGCVGAFPKEEAIVKSNPAFCGCLPMWALPIVKQEANTK
jgi:hypothetical protein